MADETPLDRFERRVGRTHFRQRFYMQVDHIAKLYERQRSIQYYQNREFLISALYYALKFSGLYRLGYRNSRNIRVVRNTFAVRGLPASFDGYRILHLSDLHVDVDGRFPRQLAERLQGLDYDLCVITGDFRFSTHGNHAGMIEGMREVVPHIKTEIYAVLGNHDFLEFVTPLEKMGVHFLLNECVDIERGGGSISLAGIDDAYFYETDNLPRALDDVPVGSVSILLSHSPETYRLAAACGCDVMLAGHTHGGQICLPGGIAVLAYASCPRKMIRGPWSHDRLQGYTSAGAGSCVLSVRFFCPPEVAIHTLQCPPS